MIRDARLQDHEELTRIAFAAKSGWHYPAEYMARWQDELTITHSYITRHIVRCKVRNRMILGFYSIVRLEKDMVFGNVSVECGCWLDHMFVDPLYQNQGIGREFFQDIENLVEEQQIAGRLKIFVDPNAKGFYEKMGATQIRISASSIPGRNIPVFQYTIVPTMREDGGLSRNHFRNCRLRTKN